MKHSLIKFKRSFSFAIAVLASSGLWAQTQISDEEGLKAIADDLAGDYVLTSDITLSGEWTPIGTSAESFTGTFDGAGHTIYGLKVGGGTDKGLFGYATNATIKNLRVIGAQVGEYGNGVHAGIIVGSLRGTSVVDGCFTSGIAYGNDHVGGIIGGSGWDGDTDVPTISNNFSAATIYSSGYQAGGIAGDTHQANFLNNLFVGQCYAGNDWNGCGGITGLTEHNGDKTFTGNVVIASQLGIDSGIGNNHLHAIVGNHAVGATLVDNLAWDGIRFYVGARGTGETVNDSIREAIQADEYNGILKSEKELKQKSTYINIGWDESAWNLADGRFPVLTGQELPLDADFVVFEEIPTEFFVDRTFDLNPFSVLGREVEVFSSAPRTVSVSEGGFGGYTLLGRQPGTATITIRTEGDDYIKGFEKTIELVVNTMEGDIYNVEEFIDKLTKNPSGEFDLNADIDLAGIDFAPLPEFRGILHGNGHVIRNARYENSGQAHVGIFQSTRNATIEDLGIEDAYFVGNEDVGGLAGTVYGGLVNRVYVVNSYIEGRDHVGSIAGGMVDNNGELSEISNCISDSRIKTREHQSGGLLGISKGGTLRNSIFCGAVDNKGTNRNNGIISLIDAGDYPTTIENCFSGAAHILGGWDGTPRISSNTRDNTTYSNNYALASTVYFSGVILDVPDEIDYEQGASVSDEEARTKAFYTDKLGLDFDNTWQFLPGTEGLAFPVLKIMKAPLKTRIFNDALTSPLIDVDGTQSKNLKMIHGSWGQKLDIQITEGADLVNQIDDELYSSEKGKTVGGKLYVKVSLPAAVADTYTVLGDDEFSILVTSEDLIASTINEIATPSDFLQIATLPAGSRFKLVNDIDMTDVAFDGFFNDGGAFEGEIDGDGHRVKNAKISFSSGSNNKGIFGQVKNSVFKNIAFENFQVLGTINGPSRVGFIGRVEDSEFDQVVLTGKVIGNDHVGILAGDGIRTYVNNSYVWADLQAYQQAGGYFGCTLDNGITIENSYFNGKVDAQRRGCAGGIIGLVDVSGATININGVATIGDVWASSTDWQHAGAFIGRNGAGGANGEIFFTNNIANADQDIVGMAAESWPFGNLTAGEGNVEAEEYYTAEELKTKAPYETIGWDFSNIWTMDTTDYGYPVLKQFGYVTTTESLLSGIATVKSDLTKSASGIFDLSGRRLQNVSAKGIYIVDGKKTVVK